MTVNCPNCGVGNHLLPNMRKPKCRKCGKLLPSPETPKAAAAVAAAAAPAKAAAAPAPEQKSPKPKTPKVPRKVGDSPETPAKEVRFVPDYEV